MKRLFLILLFAALPSFAQTHTEVTVEDNQTIIGNKTFTGAFNSCRIGSVRYVDSTNACGWSGPNACQWIQSAYSDLPAQGGVIHLGTSSGYTCPTGSEMTFTTAGKPVTLIGDGAGGPVQLTYTGSGTFITLDYNSASIHSKDGAGLQNIVLIGTSNLGTGILLGTTNGSDAAVLENTQVNGFATGISAPTGTNNGFNTTLINTTISSNTVGYSQGASLENIRCFGCFFSKNGTAISLAASTELFLFAASIDDSTTVGVDNSGGGFFYCVSCHFENVLGGTANYGTNAGRFQLQGGTVNDDVNTSNIAQLFTSTAGIFDVQDTNIFSQGRTATQVLNITGGKAVTRWLIGNTSAYATLYPSSQVLNVQDSSIRVSANNNWTLGMGGAEIQVLSSGEVSRWNGSGANPNFAFFFDSSSGSTANFRKYAIQGLDASGIRLGRWNDAENSFTTSWSVDSSDRVNFPQAVLLGSTIGNTAGTATMGLTLKKGSGGGNYTNSTTSYTVADATNLCFTVTIPTGWKLGVSASGSIGTSTAIVEASAALTDNAACSTANTGVLVETQSEAGVIAGTTGFALNWVITGDGASHNVALQFKTANSSDQANLLNSSATLTPTMKFELMPSN